jgi:hypothetical protein
MGTKGATVDPRRRVKPLWAGLVDVPDSKFVDGRPDLFRSVPPSIDWDCENRPNVPFRAVQCRRVVTGSRPFW